MTTSELTAAALKEEFENICDDFTEYEWSTYDNFEMNEESANVIKDALNLYIKKEKGLLIELPVPIGSVCYQIIQAHPCKDKAFISEQEMSLWLLASDELSTHGCGIFATREAAEKRLEELRNEVK